MINHSSNHTLSIDHTQKNCQHLKNEIKESHITPKTFSYSNENVQKMFFEVNKNSDAGKYSMQVSVKVAFV